MQIIIWIESKIDFHPVDNIHDVIPRNGTSLNSESKHWQDFNVDGNNLFLARFIVPEKTTWKNNPCRYVYIVIINGYYETSQLEVSYYCY